MATEIAELHLQQTIQQYKQKAYTRLGVLPQDMNPQLGFLANEQTLHKMYLYYQQLFLAEPSFLWIGLARMTGGQVMWGMQRFVRIAKDPCAMSEHIVQIAKDIFEKMAWQHELFLDDADLLIRINTELEKTEKPSYSFAQIWYSIKHGTAQEIAEANLHLLYNEQNNTVQKHYDLIRQDAYSKKYLWLTRFTMRCIHPYHRRFIVDVPLKDVTLFQHRWQWISHARGMWPTWCALTAQERRRLVALDNAKIMAHDWQ
jgi:hypothetical protein